jgi:hypothetical protein
MEPLDDNELNRLLRRWEAPGAPPTLRGRIPLPQPSPWRWFLTGSIRIPVPVGILAVLVLAAWVFIGRTTEAPQEQPSANSLADFQPVRQLEPKIINASDGSTK